MNGSTFQVGGVALTGGVLGDVVKYVLTVAHVNPLPPDSVAIVIGVGALMGAHAAAKWLSSRFPARAPVPTVDPAPATK